jgi:hypothetical protein
VPENGNPPSSVLYAIDAMRIPRTAKILRSVIEPETLMRAFLKKFSVGSFEFRMAFDAFDRPWYAHGMYEAATLGVKLGLSAISIIEFGVAFGDGLAAMEDLAREIRKKFGLQIEILGFDSGEGLPPHGDYRDLPYVWRRGLYKMDVAVVRRRLPTAHLILGDVRETVPKFIEDAAFPPIGFIAFDLDYYTSTMAAFRIFQGPDSQYLPRVLSYFDDIMSGDQQYYCEDVGELLAIREFNETATRNHRIRPIHGWKRSLLLRTEWADAMWAYHRFDHSRYDDYIGGSQ